MARRIDELIARQTRKLLALEERHVAKFLAAFDDSRRYLAEQLAELEASGRGDQWTAQRVRTALAMAEAGVRDLAGRLGNVLDEQIRVIGPEALRDLLDVISMFERGDFPEVGKRIEIEALQHLTEEYGLLLHRHSVNRYGLELIQAIQREIVLGRTAGLTMRETTRRIVATDRSVFAGMRGRAALIARMETHRAYDATHQRSLEVAGQILDRPGDPDPLMKRATEYLDARNHPFSRALDGRIAPINGEWEVPVAEVGKHALAMGKPIGGILWRLDADGFYRGGTYPAHFNDRGRQIPWRASWGGLDRSGGDMKREADDAAAEIRWRTGKGAPPLPTPGPTKRPPAKTFPSGKRDPARAPRGEKTIPPKAKPSIQRQHELERDAGIVFAREGYDVEFLDQPPGPGRKPDLLVEGGKFDVTAPTTSNPSQVRKLVSDKVKGHQARRVIVHLADTTVSVAELRELLKRRPIAKLAELLAIDKAGRIVRVL